MPKRAITSVLCLILLMSFSSCLPSCDEEKNDEPPIGELSEAELWKKAVTEQDVDLYEEYLKNYPAGDNAMEAKRMLKDLWKDEAAKLTPTDMARLTVVIETNRGNVRFKFFPNAAPDTCRNFIRLAKSHFYDGLLFYRVVPGYVIQGGCPENTGFGNPGYTIPAEFNDHQHLEGTVAMARGPEHDSAGSIFYICLSPQPVLDRRFTVFGQVSDGMDVVNSIGDVETDADDRPLEEQIIKRVYIEGL